MKNFITLFFILTAINPLYPGWERIHHTSEIYSLNSVDMYDNTAVVVGEAGIVRISRDTSGLNWDDHFIPDCSWLHSVVFLNANTIFAGGDDGHVYRSTDLGNSWAKHIIDSGKAVILIKFFNQSIGFYGTDDGSLFRTVDGGKKWIKVLNRDANRFYDMSIASNGDIWLSGFGKLLKSVDTGQTWENYISRDSRWDVSQRFFRICAVSKYTVYAITSFLQLYWTTNSGLTWNLTHLDTMNVEQFAVPSVPSFMFFSDATGLIRINSIAGMGEYLEFSTIDGGLTFQKKYLQNSFGTYSGYMNTICIGKNNFGFSSEHNGGIYKVWLEKKSSNYMNFRYEKRQGANLVNFQKTAGYDPDNFLVSSDNMGLQMWITSDGGKTWIDNEITSKTSYLPNAKPEDVFYFSDKSIFFSVRPVVFEVDSTGSRTYQYGAILVSKDGGKTYTTFKSNDTLLYSHFMMLNPQYGCFIENKSYNEYYFTIGKFKGNILYTTDGAESWHILPVPEETYNPLVVSSPEPGVFFAYFNGSASTSYSLSAYRTNDYGENWSKIDTSWIKFTRKMLFIDRQTGYAITTSVYNNQDSRYYYYILKTTDAGDSWNICYSDSYSSYNYIFTEITTKENNIYVTRNNKNESILFSSDGGKTWRKESLPSVDGMDLINGICMLTPNICVAVGNSSKIYINRKMVDYAEEEPDILSLGKISIYPNPSSEFVNIEVSEDIKKIDDAILEVFDLMGKKVYSGYFDSPYSKKIDISKFDSGVYFIRIGKHFTKFIKN